MRRTLARNDELLERARRVIPGGMYGHESVALLPEGTPQFFRHAEGARLWDVDGNEYIDYLCAYGPNLLGYRYAPVERAADAQRAHGDTLTGPAAPMVELAEKLVALVRHAEWALFCKNGSDATSMAVTIARAHTGRRKILAARGAYHGASHWSTPIPTGTLPEDRAHVLYYDYNDPESLAATARQAGDDLAGIWATPFRHEVFADQVLPSAEFAREARRLCDQSGALLMLDEVRTGFRLARGCSWSKLGVEPDLSAWGKCLANGHPISALLGCEKAREAAQHVFVTGSFWFSAVPMAAGVATLHEIETTDYLERIEASARMLREGLDKQAAAHGLTLRQSGPPQMPQILFGDDPDFRLGYAWIQEAMQRGVYLHPFHNMFLCAAHGEAEIQQTLAATDEAFGALKKRRASLGPMPQLQAFFAEIGRG